MTSTAARPSRSEPAPVDGFAAAAQVADAILYEGYLLYPYRRSSAKNRVRWQFGVLAPRAWVETQQVPDPGVAGSAESWFQQAECLAEAPPDATLRVRLRFLQVQRRQVYADGQPVDSLDTGETAQLSFDEALPRETEAAFGVADVLTAEQYVTVEHPGDRRTEQVPGGSVERTSQPLHARLRVAAERADAPFPLLRLRIQVENTAVDDNPGRARDAALADSLIATHLLLGLDRGRFVSLLEPPEWASPAAAQCSNRHVFPVLAGAGEGADVALCSPIILYDHPRVAPESPGDLHDAAEIDEILSLRTLTLTDAEKREARATDPRAAAIVDRVDAMPPELLAKLHGAVRDLRPAVAAEPDDELPWWDPRAEAAVQPDTDTVLVAGREVGPGARVRLHPRGRGSDAYDMFLADRIGRVHKVLHDVDGSIRVAVTVEDDPAAELHQWYGRFFHFTPDEISPL